MIVNTLSIDMQQESQSHPYLHLSQDFTPDTEYITFLSDTSCMNASPTRYLLLVLEDNLQESRSYSFS